MGQFLRPVSNVTRANWTGGYAEIDEAVASDADTAYCNNSNATCTLEVALSAPGSTPGPGTTTVRYRAVLCRTTDGAPSGSSSRTLTAYVYEGATLRATDTGRTLSSATFATWEWTPDLSAVTDWGNLRLRFVCTTTAGLGAALSWAEMEVPSTSYTLSAESGSFSLAGTTTDLRYGYTIAAASGAFVFSGSAVGLIPALVFSAASGSFTLTGTAADLLLALKFEAGSGVFLLAGADAEFTAHFKSYSFTGNPGAARSAARARVAYSRR